ncbi:hypothetical protein G6F56_001297 [Rhizopus delemar]|nr:hypothetical protein G6F56_001297 [Rhizopus delemar]
MKKGLGKLLFKRGNKPTNEKSQEIVVNDTYKPVYESYDRESSGSIYSTFGTESMEMPKAEEEETTTDEDTIEEDIKREKTAARLSKRLSGGHFGSAGGLMLSMIETSPPPEDIQESMINWKRKSGQMLQKFVLPEEEVDEAEEARGCALKLWDEDETFVQREKIAEWLGQSKSLNATTLSEYMAFFDFKTMRIDSSFRKVCSKLYFRAEAQQIDRILEAFAKRYWECNPRSILRNSDTVYAIVYSILLLNTDLHVAQGNYTRMTRQVFIKNTMTTIRDQPANKSESFPPMWETQIESYLKDLYTSVKHNQILHPLSQQHEMVNNTKRLSIMGTRRMNDFKKNINTIMNKNGARESVFYQEDPIPRKSTSSVNKPRSPYTLRSPRRDSFSSIQSSSSVPHVDPLPDRPPYHKEGLVMRKHLLECANQKAKHREWRECLLVVSQGRLRMFDNNAEESSLLSRAGNSSFANISDTLRPNNISSFSVAPKSSISSSSISSATVDNNKWAFTHSLGSIQLSHSLSNSLPPPGYNRSRPFVFAIQEPNGGVFLFQTKSQDQTLEWVATCNYWAARESKEPLLGGVGNIEYGWGSCLDNLQLDLASNDTVNISTWLPPTPTTVPSTLDEATQYDNLRRYLDSLNEEIDQHGDIKDKMLIRFPHKSQYHVRVLANWEAKSKYMLHEIIKYQNYCDVLEKSISEKREDL